MPGPLAPKAGGAIVAGPTRTFVDLHAPDTTTVTSLTVTLVPGDWPESIKMSTVKTWLDVDDAMLVQTWPNGVLVVLLTV